MTADAVQPYFAVFAGEGWVSVIRELEQRVFPLGHDLIRVVARIAFCRKMKSLISRTNTYVCQTTEWTSRL